MATFQNTVTIRRAVEDVFTFLANFENIPKWNYAIVETKKTSPGAVGVGTTYRQIRSIPERSEEGFKVTAFEPASRLEVHGDIGPFIATISYLLTPIGDGTRLTNAVDLKPSSAVLRLFAPWLSLGSRPPSQPTWRGSTRSWKRDDPAMASDEKVT
jgi:hypothetical protein